MKIPPLTTSFPKSIGNNIEIDQIVNPKGKENPECLLVKDTHKENDPVQTLEKEPKF
jgi:hypothetical protein